MGFRAVDLSVFPGGPHTTLEEVIEDPASAAARVIPRLKRNELAVSDVFAIYIKGWDDHPINSPDADERRRLRREFEKIVDFALRVGAPGISILAGVLYPNAEKESIARAAEELQYRAELSRRHGLPLSFEPCIESVADTPDRLDRILELAPDAQVMLDYSHFVYQGFSDEEVDRFLPRTRHFQCRQAAPGVLQAPTSEGVIDFGRVAAKARQLEFDDYFDIEYIRMPKWNSDRVDVVSETVRLRDIFLKTGEFESADLIAAGRS